MSEVIEFESIEPDALIVATRKITIAPIAGRPASTGVHTETVRLARFAAITTLTTTTVGPFTGDLSFFIGGDEEAAEVNFVRLREELRRDGWTLVDVVTAAMAEIEAPF